MAGIPTGMDSNTPGRTMATTRMVLQGISRVEWATQIVSLTTAGDQSVFRSFVFLSGTTKTLRLPLPEQNLQA